MKINTMHKLIILAFLSLFSLVSLTVGIDYIPDPRSISLAAIGAAVISGDLATVQEIIVRYPLKFLGQLAAVSVVLILLSSGLEMIYVGFLQEFVISPIKDWFKRKQIPKRQVRAEKVENIEKERHEVQQRQAVQKREHKGIEEEKRKKQVRIEKQDKSEQFPLERTIYDPVLRNFLVSSERPLANIRKWIEDRDPRSYWCVICIHNNSESLVDEWGIELNSTSSLRVIDTYIEGHEGSVTVMKSHPKPWLSQWALGVSHHAGIVIPRGGSRRIYIKLGSDACGVSHSITGRFVSSQGTETPIREKTFTHSCDVATLRTALSSDPAAAGQYAENIIRRAYDRDTALKLLRSLKLVQEIDQCCTLQNYDEILNRMQLLAGTLEDIQAGDKLTRLVKQNYDALTILGDSEASAERAQRLCSNVIDVWINEFICMEDPKKHSFKSKPRERGEDAGKCPVCGSRLVWRRAQKNNELYRGCTNFDGGCRWNDRSY